MILLAVIGFASGIISGMGIGGGAVLISALVMRLWVRPGHKPDIFYTYSRRGTDIPYKGWKRREKGSKAHCPFRARGRGFGLFCRGEP